MITERLTGKRLLTRLSADGKLELFIEREAIAAPSPGEVVVRVEAAPINPSDLGLLLGPADLNTLYEVEPGRRTEADVPPEKMMAVAARIGKALPAGNEGAGVVVAAGAGCEAMMGRTVAVLGRTMYAQFHLAAAEDCLLLPEGIAPAQAAAAFINPLTALGMIETMRRHGHSAIVHTAAASSLGQILTRLCHAEGIGLVNIVRRREQAELLKGQGARHVCVSTEPGFGDELRAALAMTGATLLFDAIGGGNAVSQILAAMEDVAVRQEAGYARYGSTILKQAYIYGGLDPGPTVLDRSFGLSWTVGGWLLTSFLASLSKERVEAMRRRVAAELGSTFASEHAGELSLEEAISPDAIRTYASLSTGAKYLINPSKQPGALVGAD